MRGKKATGIPVHPNAAYVRVNMGVCVAKKPWLCHAFGSQTQKRARLVQVMPVDSAQRLGGQEKSLCDMTKGEKNEDVCQNRARETRPSQFSELAALRQCLERREFSEKISKKFKKIFDDRV